VGWGKLRWGSRHRGHQRFCWVGWQRGVGADGREHGYRRLAGFRRKHGTRRCDGHGWPDQHGGHDRHGRGDRLGGTGATGGATGTGGLNGSGGATGAGGATASGGATGSGGVTGSGTGGAAGSGSGGTGAASAMPSAGCGKTSTLTFGSVPNESASAAAGSGNGVGFGQGGYVTLNDSKAGGSRGFALRLPKNYDNNHPYWLMFDYHWNGGDAAQCDNGGTSGYEFAYYGLQAKSNEGAIFVGPDSIGSGWSNTNDQDLYFTDDMVKLISDNYCVDMSNLITTGFSWGGGMSYELACARANAADDKVGYAFRAAVIFEGAQLSWCDNGKDPIALWQMVGVTTPPVRSAWRHQFATSSSRITDARGGHQRPVTPRHHRLRDRPLKCSANCPCTWMFDDVWTWLNSPGSNAHTPNATVEPTPPN
jgi:hypothetical protein